MSNDRVFIVSGLPERDRATIAEGLELAFGLGFAEVQFVDEMPQLNRSDWTELERRVAAVHEPKHRSRSKSDRKRNRAKRWG